jgi:SM-20-related protein
MSIAFELSAAVELSTAGVYVQDHYLDAPQVQALLSCLEARREQGAFQAARVGKALTLRRDAGVRGDFTCWLQEPLFAAERELLDRLEQLRLALNRDLYLGLFDLELHYAWYPPGAGYERHVDQSLGDSTRQLSLVLYLNDTWSAAAGGELRIFDNDGSFRDFAPQGGRLVCFRTPQREHSVLPASRDRFSLSGWFRTRD